MESQKSSWIRSGSFNVFVVLLSWVTLAGPAALAGPVVPSIDEGAWSGASLGILEIGALVILKKDVQAGAVFFPDRSSLRVVGVESNHPEWVPGKYSSVTELPADFDARVLLGPDSETSEGPILSLGCRRMSLGRGADAAKTFFACSFYPLGVLDKDVRVYRGGR